MTDINKETTYFLLNRLVYGIEPDNCAEILAELKRRGIKTDPIMDKIDKLIRECLYASNQS